MRSGVQYLALALALLISGGCQERMVDEEIDFEALKLDACERACGTIDTCDPDKFDGMEPEDCFERCMTLLPQLHEENQCGSDEILYLRCIGDIDCEGFAEFEAGAGYPADYTAPCVTEIEALCSTNEPFDLDHVSPGRAGNRSSPHRQGKGRAGHRVAREPRW